MLTPILNELRFDLKINFLGPLLIREGRLARDEQAGLNWKDDFAKRKIIDADQRKRLPDSFFVCRNSQEDLEAIVRKEAYHDLKLYLPGTSLRGVLRSRAEYITRKLSPNIEGPLCCDPFHKNFCGKYFTKREEDTHVRLSAKEIYKRSCAVCRIFGNTAFASRIEVEDSSDIQGERTIRDHIAIDRFTGGVRSGANFKDLCAENKTFTSKVRVFNFETWQLGLLAYVLRDLEKGLLAIGGGKSKGYGNCTAAVENLQVHYWGSTPRDKLLGIASLYAKLADEYDCLSVREPDGITLIPIDSEENMLYRKKYKVSGPTTVSDNPFWGACARVWNEVIRNTKSGPKELPHLLPLSKLCQH
jgi:CRISPR-associated RAMP protein (TIGR02581 family)